MLPIAFPTLQAICTSGVVNDLKENIFKHNYGKIFSLEKKLVFLGGNESKIQGCTQNVSFVALKIEKLQLS